MVNEIPIHVVPWEGASSLNHPKSVFLVIFYSKGWLWKSKFLFGYRTLPAKIIVNVLWINCSNTKHTFRKWWVYKKF